MSAPIAFLTSRPRVEEKLLLAELARRGAEAVRVDDGALRLDLGLDAGEPPPESPPWALAWNRSVSFGRALYATEALEARGVPQVNPARTVRVCGDKALTSIALQEAGVPSVRTTLCFTPEAAMEAAAELGYPCVLKPVVGSWGRLVARLDTPAAAEAVLEDRAVLGSWQHSIFYVQEYVEKAGRDARVFVIGGQAVAGIWRTSEHWITNTARGAVASRCDVSGELGAIAEDAARAVGGGILAIDLVETKPGPAVLEVNHSGEFRNSIETTGVDLPGVMVDHVLSLLGAQGTRPVDAEAGAHAGGPPQGAPPAHAGAPAHRGAAVHRGAPVPAGTAAGPEPEAQPGGPAHAEALP